MDKIQDLLSDLTLELGIKAELSIPLQQRIDALQKTLAITTRGVNTRIAKLETKLREEVLTHGETVKGTRLWAVYNRGRTSWNSQGLVGYGVAHPEIFAFRKQGKPYVSIRSAPRRQAKGDHP